jgi:hypothetical protein
MRHWLHPQHWRALSVFFITLLLAGIVAGQAPAPAPPAPPPVNQSDDPILMNFKWRSIGPASMGGRIDDIAAVESNPYIIYVGFATGGVWKTVNNGTTWEPIFDTYPTNSIGDIAIFQADPNIIWVGTGEPNNRQSSSFGDGIYRSTDGGKSFTNVGLKETQTIARIVLDPKDPNIAYVAAPGHLFGPNPERGIYKTSDGGKTWRIMSNNNNRPMYYSQVRVDPSNGQIVYTGGLQFSKSTDGGKTFQASPGVAHSDHHAIWIDPKNGNHLIIGNDGGLNFSYDQGATWEFVNNIPAGQFYAVAADMRRPYYLYGGLQDNGSWGGPSATRSNAGITNADWYRVGGGDGFHCQVDPSDHHSVYCESQNGMVSRIDLLTGRSTMIRPRAAAAPRGQRQAGAQAAEPAPQTAEAQPTVAGAPAQEAQMGGFFRDAGTPNIVPPPPAGEQYRFNWSTPIS